MWGRKRQRKEEKGTGRAKLSDWKASELGLVEISGDVGQWNGSVWQPSLKLLPPRLRLWNSYPSSSALSSDLTLSQRNPPCAAEADLSGRRAQTAGNQPRQPAAAQLLENIMNFHRHTGSNRSVSSQFVAPNGLSWEWSWVSWDFGKRGFYKVGWTSGRRLSATKFLTNKPIVMLI